MTKLTEKQKAFCREYVANGGNGTEAYLTAYDSQNRTVASNEASKLLKREDITEYLVTLNAPTEAKAKSEREKKRRILWDGIEQCKRDGNHSGVARYMELLCKMDGDFTDIMKPTDEKTADIINLDTDTLLKLVK